MTLYEKIYTTLFNCHFFYFRNGHFLQFYEFRDPFHSNYSKKSKNNEYSVRNLSKGNEIFFLYTFSFLRTGPRKKNHCSYQEKGITENVKYLVSLYSNKEKKSCHTYQESLVTKVELLSLYLFQERENIPRGLNRFNEYKLFLYLYLLRLRVF